MSDLNTLLVSTAARDEKGRFSSVTPTEPAGAEAAPEPTPTPEPVNAAEAVKAEPSPVKAEPTESARRLVPIESLLDEREKRQAAEAHARELEQRHANTPEPKIDPWTDLQGYLNSQEQKNDERLFVERCNLTEEIARDRHKDYDEVAAVFVQAMRESPQLAMQMRQEKNPAAFAYREGLRIKELKEVGGDFVAYKSKLEKEADARAEAKYAAKATSPAVPVSLNSDGSPAPVETFSGPPSLKEILRTKR